MLLGCTHSKNGYYFECRLRANSGQSSSNQSNGHFRPLAVAGLNTSNAFDQSDSYVLSFPVSVAKLAIIIIARLPWSCDLRFQRIRSPYCKQLGPAGFLSMFSFTLTLAYPGSINDWRNLYAWRLISCNQLL